MKVGVFLSDCGGLLDKHMDISSVAEKMTVKGFHLERVDDFYDIEAFDTILDRIGAHELDGIVLAGNSPYTYKHSRNGSYIISCTCEKGVNANHIEPVNLINMVALAHEAHPTELVDKACLMIEAAVAKINCSEPIVTVEVAPRKAVAIVGAGIGSLIAAQTLLDQGCKVHAVYKSSDYYIPAKHLQVFSPTAVYVKRHPRFQAYPGSSPDGLVGYPGDYTLTVSSGQERKDIPVGAVIITFEPGSAGIKDSQTLFRLDIKEDGTVAAMGEISARSRTMERGVFIINPKDGDKADAPSRVLAADGAAACAANLLSTPEIRHQVAVSRVKPDLCGGCGVCLKACMFDAVTVRKSLDLSEIYPRKCRGCGNCVTACPTGARDLILRPTRSLFSTVDIYSRFKTRDGSPRILLVVCEGCGYPCLDRAGQKNMIYPVGVMPLAVSCGAQVDMQLLLHGFTKGFDAVALMICGEGCCHNIIGNVDLERRVNLLRSILHSRDVDPARIHVIATCARDGEACVDELNDYYEKFVGRAAS